MLHGTLIYTFVSCCGVRVDDFCTLKCTSRCGHCKRLAPEYETAATTLAGDDPPIPLAKVDCPANNALCGEFGVSGYPTLKIFRGGELSADYNGPRNAGKATSKVTHTDIVATAGQTGNLFLLLFGMELPLFL